MTKGLLKSSPKPNKLFKNCIGKPKTHSTHIRYIQNILCNKLKQIAKTTYYADQINLFKNDSKNLEITLNNDWRKQ